MSDSDPADIALYLTGEILEEVPEDAGLYQMDLHKILYLLQRTLDDGNAVAENLPFYWYLHGPVSQAAFDASDVATRAGIATAENEADSMTLSPGPKSPPTPSIDSDNLEEASSKISEIVEDYRFHTERDRMLQDEIYVNAPYGFQPEFKFNTLPAVQEFSQSDEGDREAVLKALYRAEGKLPLNESFERFNSEFSRFVSLADTFLSEEGERRPLLRGQLAELADIAWRVFCNHLRVETAGEQYDNEIARWERKADQSLSTFRKSLNDFESRLLEAELYASDVSRTAEDEPWTEMANSILNES